MMLSIRCLLMIIITSMALQSCYSPRYVYSPPTQNIPALEKKKDLLVTASFAPGAGGSGGPAYNRGLDLHLTYAFSKHWAVMANQFNRWEKNGSENSFFSADSVVLRYKRALTEFGLGYFKPINEDSSNFIQIFAGAAFGKFTISDIATVNGIKQTKFHDASISKIFIQPALTFRQRKNYSAALSSRFTAVFYNRIKTNYSDIELDNYILDSLDVSPVFFWEPAMNFTFSTKKIKGLKLQLQFSNSILLNKRFIDSRSWNIGIGIVADIRKLMAKSKAAE